MYKCDTFNAKFLRVLNNCNCPNKTAVLKTGIHIDHLANTYERITCIISINAEVDDSEVSGFTYFGLAYLQPASAWL